MEIWKESLVGGSLYLSFLLVNFLLKSSKSDRIQKDVTYLILVVLFCFILYIKFEPFLNQLPAFWNFGLVCSNYNYSIYNQKWVRN